MKPTLYDTFLYDIECAKEKIKKSVFEKYFEVRTTDMNKLTAKYLKEYFEVADIVSKVFLSYYTIDLNLTITTIHKTLSEKWSLNSVDIPRQRLGKFLRNVYMDGIDRDVKFLLLDTIIETAFNNHNVYKYVLARMTADNKAELIKVFHKMADNYYRYYEESNNRYFKPSHSDNDKTVKDRVLKYYKFNSDKGFRYYEDNVEELNKIN